MVAKTVPKSTETSLRTGIEKERKGVRCFIFFKGGRKTRVLSEDLLLAVGLGYAQSVLNLWHHFMPLHATSLQCRFRPWNFYDSCQERRMHHEKLKAASKHKKSPYLFEQSEDSQVVPCVIFFDFSRLSSWPLLFLQRIWLQTAEELAETWRFDVRVSRTLTPSVTSNTRCDTMRPKTASFQ